MEYRRYNNENILSIYQKYYSDIHGGIDGYYEKMILDAQIYEVIEETTLAYFSLHPERGWTSLVVLDEYKNQYCKIFEYVLGLGIFRNILFTGNDKEFLNQIQKHGISYEIQAYNFSAHQTMNSTIVMTLTTEADIEKIKKGFNDFIQYNDIHLNQVESFYYEMNDELISFGALEPLRVNPNRYCISMIVSEPYRRKGFGSKTVRFLVEHLQKRGLDCNARCYVLNEASKKTLLNSGMVISNCLYKCELVK